MLWHGVGAQRRLKKSPCLRVKTDKMTGNPPKMEDQESGLAAAGCQCKGGLQGSLAVGCS